MKKRQDRIERMTRVDREYQAAAIAADLLWEKLCENPSLLSPMLRARDGEMMRRNIEIAYPIRLFAEFEAGLREAWSDALGQTTIPPMRDLVDAYTARRSIPTDMSEAVHRVREYRNSLLHGGTESPVSIAGGTPPIEPIFCTLARDLVRHEGIAKSSSLSAAIKTTLKRPSPALTKA